MRKFSSFSPIGTPAANRTPDVGAKLLVPSVWVREPRLMVPGQKPVGPVRIDWSHPFTRDLGAYIIVGPSGPVELVSNSPPTTYGAVTGRAKGDGWRTGGAAGAYYVVPTPRCNVSGKKCVAISGWADDADTDRWFHATDSALTTDIQLWAWCSTQFRIQNNSVTGSGVGFSAISCGSTENIDGIANFAPSTALGWARSGNIIAPYDVDVGTRNDIAFENIMFGKRPSSATYYDVGMRHCVVWNNPVWFNSSMMLEFLLSPYQFLIPA